jgi:hypothetical protein
MRTMLFTGFNLACGISVFIGVLTWVTQPDLGLWPLTSAIWAATAMIQSWRLMTEL